MIGRASRLAIAAALMMAWSPLAAHINSPHIYLEQDAGPFPAVAIVHLPTAIPGEAELQLRLLDLGPDETVQVRTREVPPQGEAHAPPWVDAAASAVDAAFFTAPIPMMQFGVWRTQVEIRGDRGVGMLEIPVPAKRPNPGVMGPGLATVLLLLLAVLLVNAWTTLNVLGRDATRSPGSEPSAKDRKAGRRMAAIGVIVILSWIGFIGFSWYQADAGIRSMGIPPLRAGLGLPDGPVTAGRTNRVMIEVQNRRGERVREFTPDHGKWMHLTLIRQPQADIALHVHPWVLEPGVFGFRFTPPAPGKYRMLAEVLEPTGEPQTVSAVIEVGPGPTPASYNFSDPDDTQVFAAGFDEALVGAVTSAVGDGLVLRWLDPDPVLLVQGEFHRLTFQLEDETGTPVDALEPLLGTLGHMLVLAHDGEVWAHLYPTGTLGGSVDTSSLAAVSGARVAFPYGFPRAGKYRCWVQVRYGGAPRTGVFDVDVR